MPVSSFGGDSHTKEESGWRLQPERIDGPKWAGEPWDEERPVGDFEYVEDGPAYVEDQVIVMGRGGDVEKIVSEALRQTEKLRDSIVVDRLLSADDLERFPDQGQGPVIIDLYHTGGMTVSDAVMRIREQAASEGKAVFVDPNYVTGHPYIPVGSPYIPVGSAPTVPEEAEGEFWEQWAFKEQRGIGLTAGGHPLNSLGTGAGIRVAVFDTSPFPDPGFWRIHWITPRMDLCVSHLLGAAHTTTGTADHGLFVAGLVHAVAPGSEIELIQVLNEDAVGDLDTLNDALTRFMLQRRANNAGTLKNTVMNLSLGFPEPPAQSDPDLDLVCFKALLRGAESHEAVVVAAAGNASSPALPLPPDVPAAYGSVIGVAASNMELKRSCFSNMGDVAAPGGDTYKPSTKECTDQLVVEKNQVIGAVMGLALNSSPNAGYIYWVGTSFSAPLVSGLAALMIERGVAVPLLGSIGVKHPAPPPNTPLGKGIIDVPNSVT